MPMPSMPSCGSALDDMHINRPSSILGQKLRHLDNKGKKYRLALAFVSIIFLVVGLYVVAHGTYFRHVLPAVFFAVTMARASFRLYQVQEP